MATMEPSSSSAPPPRDRDFAALRAPREHRESENRETVPLSVPAWRPNRERSEGRPAGRPQIGTVSQRPPVEDANLKCVVVDAAVLIKILQSCREHYPTPVNGQLLGLDRDDRLEVTGCFVLPNKRDLYSQLAKDKNLADEKNIDEKVHVESQRYQSKMVEQLRQVNSDSLTVGWYQTMSFDDLKDLEVIDSLCIYQESVDKAVVIGFDPLLSTMGKMAFKAYRVSKEFLRRHREAEEIGPAVYDKLRGKDILVEVPIVIRNPLLAEAFLLEWIDQDTSLQLAGDFESLELADQANYTEKSLGFICDCLDELVNEQDKLMRYQRESFRQQTKLRELAELRRIENEQRKLNRLEQLPTDINETNLRKLEVPSQLPTLLMSNQVSNLTAELNQIAASNVSKAFLLNSGIAKSEASA